MPKNSYAEKINSAKVMLAGLKQYADRVGKRGIDADFIAGFETMQRNSMELDNQQEDLKAKLKQKTAELDDQIKALDGKLSEALKVVKLEMEKESWKAFGVQASR
jgi:predicted nuclease with TOPRIM domain